MNKTNKELLEKFIQETKRTTETGSLRKALVDLYNKENEA